MRHHEPLRGEPHAAAHQKPSADMPVPAAEHETPRGDDDGSLDDLRGERPE